MGGPSRWPAESCDEGYVLRFHPWESDLRSQVMTLSYTVKPSSLLRDQENVRWNRARKWAMKTSPVVSRRLNPLMLSPRCMTKRILKMLPRKSPSNSQLLKAPTLDSDSNFERLIDFWSVADCMHTFDFRQRTSIFRDRIS